MAHAECTAQRKLAEQRAQEGLGELGLDSKHKCGSPNCLLAMTSLHVHHNALVCSDSCVLKGPYDAQPRKAIDPAAVYMQWFVMARACCG